MQREFYETISEPFRQDETKRKALNMLNKVITGFVFCMYPITLVWLFAVGDSGWIRFLLVPAVSFVLVTLFRKVCNAQRPYEKWDLEPVIPRDKKGQSFPSRHVFSIFIIAMAVGWVCPIPGVVLIVAGVFLAVTRVAAVVHFVRDVVAGSLIAVAAGLIGFWLI